MLFPPNSCHLLHSIIAFGITSSLECVVLPSCFLGLLGFSEDAWVMAYAVCGQGEICVVFLLWPQVFC